VIGEVAPPDRAEKALESVHEKLNSEFGIALIWPPYERGSERVRGTTTFQPGSKENGGIFCHANTWAIMATAMLGQGDRAFQYYRQILPLAREDADRFKVEPYVYCQNICGPAHPQFGLGRNAWLTGTASWTYVAGTQWILGIRPTYDGLRIAPAIPRDWPGFRARRVFRGVVHNITVKRAGEGNNVSLVVDGTAVEGDVAPLPSGKSEVEVEVTLS
jgi:cellobiose phosphorylase